MTRRREQRVREALARALPADDEAEQRALRVVSEAFAERAPAPRRSRAAARAAAAAGVAALGLGLALTPAGATVREWIADAIQIGDEDARPVLGSLPTEGSVLVESEGGTWVVREDGSRRRLGDYAHATWSPNGLYVGASKGRDLFALTPEGEVRWAITAPAAIRSLDWSADEGFRVAYVAGRELRVVAGDGAGDAAAGRVGSRAIAWRPEDVGGRTVHELAYTDPQNRVVLTDTDSGRVLWRSRPVAAEVGTLQWSADGERLMIGAESFAFLVDASGQALFKGPVATGTEFTLSASGQEVALVRPVRTGRARLALAGLGPGLGRERSLYPSSAAGGDAGFGRPVFSPDGAWILLPWPRADQWIFVRIADRRVVAVADVSRTLAAGSRGPAGFPRIAGWCC